jgi:hypothetical protein
MQLVRSLLVVLAVGLATSHAAAQSDAASTEVHHVSPPPPPSTHAPDVSLLIGGAPIVPLYRGGFCPGDHTCVMNSGLAITVGLERRWSDGWAILARYDAWVVDAGTLFDIGLLNSVRVGARYVIDQSTLVHPYIEALAGFLAFGDTRSVAAVGGSVTLAGGTEIELTDSIVIDLDVQLFSFATGLFVTRDNVRRSDGFAPNLALQITLGLEVLLGSF